VALPIAFYGTGTHLSTSVTKNKLVEEYGFRFETCERVSEPKNKKQSVDKDSFSKTRNRSWPEGK